MIPLAGLLMEKGVKRDEIAVITDVDMFSKMRSWSLSKVRHLKSQTKQESLHLILSLYQKMHQ